MPTIGSFYPQPPWPVKVFPYIFLAYMIAGGIWLYIVHKRQPTTLAEIEVDLARAPELIEEEIEIDGVSPQPVMA